VLPVPYERTVTYGKGTAAGPAAIIDASFQIEDFDEELKIPMDLRVQTLPSLDFSDLSEIQAIEKIQAAAAPVLADKRFLMAFGGEHTISLPLVTATKQAYGKVSVLQLDAHTDLRHEYDNSKLSHACVMRRIREAHIQTVHVATRSMSIEEHDYVQKQDVPVFWEGDVRTDNETWIDRVCDSLSDPVYVTVDIDALDPSIAPGTGAPEPGGMGWYEVTELLRKVFASHKVVAADIVETSPIPGSQVTQFTAARLAAKMLTYHKHCGKDEIPRLRSG
jgi:agmatinase